MLNQKYILPVLVLLLLVGLYAAPQLNSQPITITEQQIKENEEAYEKIKRLTHVTDQYAGDLYFISNQDFGHTCPSENIDWDIAVRALSEYQYAHGKENMGPAEIQRHFEENCVEDMAIYNKYKAVVDIDN